MEHSMGLGVLENWPNQFIKILTAMLGLDFVM